MESGFGTFNRSGAMRLMSTYRMAGHLDIGVFGLSIAQARYPSWQRALRRRRCVCCAILSIAQARYPSWQRPQLATTNTLQLSFQSLRPDTPHGTVLLFTSHTPSY